MSLSLHYRHDDQLKVIYLVIVVECCLQLWPVVINCRCPKTVENFCVHSRNGYYNGHIFHRVIKGFMIQTGDPLGLTLSAFCILAA